MKNESGERDCGKSLKPQAAQSNGLGRGKEKLLTAGRSWFCHLHAIIYSYKEYTKILVS